MKISKDSRPWTRSLYHSESCGRLWSSLNKANIFILLPHIRVYLHQRFKESAVQEAADDRTATTTTPPPPTPIARQRRRARGRSKTAQRRRRRCKPKHIQAAQSQPISSAPATQLKLNPPTQLTELHKAARSRWHRALKSSIWTTPAPPRLTRHQAPGT